MTRTRVASLTLTIIGLLVLTGCVRPLSGKPSNESAAAAATMAAARSTEAAAVQIIAQATQNAQRPATATSGRTPAPVVTVAPSRNAASIATPFGTPSSGGSSCGADVFGNAYDCSPLHDPYGAPVPMPPGMGNLPLIAQMVGGSGSPAPTSGSAPGLTPTETVAQPRPIILKGHEYEVESVVWSPEGKRVASVGKDGSLRMWDIENGKVLFSSKTQGFLWSVAWSPDGAELASTGSDQRIHVWSATTGQAIRDNVGTSWNARSISWSPDGGLIAWADAESKTPCIADARSGKSLHVLLGHTGWVWSVAWSPDGKQLASSGDDTTIRIWDVTTGQQLRVLKGHTDWVRSVAWSPDGKRLASGSDDLTIRIWNAATGDLVYVLDARQYYPHGSIYALAWSPDGNELAWGGLTDHTTRVSDTNDWRELHMFVGDVANSVAWSPDGTRLASGGDQHNVWIWDLATK